MSDKIYAIVDIETTGGRANRDRITEIGIVLHNGEEVIRTYQSLVNPETVVPPFITRLTGITQEMVDDAPYFYEIAKDIVQLTEDAIFVAHNVRFDYGFIKEEFKRLGYTFTRKKLCTVQLSRKTFPGLGSYSLENLIKHFQISTKDRHRALEDALATADLFKRIIQQQNSPKAIHSLVNLGMKESVLPANISLNDIHQLPEECGVYYMHDEIGRIVYIGKSINIKKRIAEHFADQTPKAAKMQKTVHDITYELTGSELVALLLESAEIKKHRPPINRAQRVRHFPYAIHYFYNTEGYLCFEVKKIEAKDRSKYHIIAQFPKLWSAKSKLKQIMHEYELCAHLCYIEKGSSACFNYHIKKCKGACIQEENWESYNERAHLAMEKISIVFEKDILIVEKGRTDEELAVVLIKDQTYQGYGYIQKEEAHDNTALAEAVKHQNHNPEVLRIIQGFLARKEGVVSYEL